MDPQAAQSVIDFTSSAKLIGAGLAAMGMIGAGVGLGVLFGSYLQAAIRNPAAAASQQTMLFLGMALTETMGLFAFVVSLIILFGS
jgi:F-type H+-transporting ATPase subunit c